MDTAASLLRRPTRKRTPLTQWPSPYAPWRRRLNPVGWIREGDVQDRNPGAGGPGDQWTRKGKGKTVSVALSKAQYLWLKAAMPQWRQRQATLKEMPR